MYSLLLFVSVLVPVLYYFIKPDSIESVPSAQPSLPFIGNSISFGRDPVKYLLAQRSRLGDIFLVNLAVFKVVFFLGPEGTNAIFKGTDHGGISFLAAMTFVIGPPLEKGTQE